MHSKSKLDRHTLKLQHSVDTVHLESKRKLAFHRENSALAMHCVAAQLLSAVITKTYAH